MVEKENKEEVNKQKEMFEKQKVRKEKLLPSLKIMSESFRPDIFEFKESEEEKEFGKGDITWINVFED